ncbi:MAG: type II toxin-antitoxin system RatA family toxin [Xanthobacteraceae bacterium]
MPSYSQRRHLRYAAQQLFDLVADIEKYPEFLEWFVAARIIHRDGNVLEVAQIMRFAGFRAQIVTWAVLDPLRQIAIGTRDPRFKSFDQRWTFTPAPDGGTTVEYQSTVELRSRVAQHLIRALFDERQIAETTVNAFERRARQICGPPLDSLCASAG